MDYNLEYFNEVLNSWNLHLSEKQIQQFLTYYEMLIEKNKVMNLTAITEFDQVIEKHFLDSIALYNVTNLNGDLSIIDVGTGAGFPGIPLKIAFPNLRITLLDSLNKRVNFLNEVIDQLALEHIEAYHGRAEDFGKDPDFREKYDLCLSRAVANLSTLSEICIPFVKVGGKFIAYKSEKAEEELAQAKKAISILGGSLESLSDFHLPKSSDYRVFLQISKSIDTPSKYPRKAGIPGKKPL